MENGQPTKQQLDDVFAEIAEELAAAKRLQENGAFASCEERLRDDVLPLIDKAEVLAYALRAEWFRTRDRPAPRRKWKVDVEKIIKQHELTQNLRIDLRENARLKKRHGVSFRNLMLRDWIDRAADVHSGCRRLADDGAMPDVCSELAETRAYVEAALKPAAQLRAHWYRVHTGQPPPPGRLRRFLRRLLRR